MTPPPSRAVVVFARVPALGRVKTRLAASIGEAGALMAYRELAESTLGAIAALPDCDRVVAFTPDEGEREMRLWLGDAARYEAQAHGDLGRRMHAAIARRLAEGAERVAVIGTDCPDVGAADVERAFEKLADADLVLGPATDGGYWLIAMKAALEAPFDRIPWSNPDTLTETLRRAREFGLKVALLDRKTDVDTVVEWRAWKERRTAVPTA
jgi:rSAM/selenodomain-associated transferase 1